MNVWTHPIQHWKRSRKRMKIKSILEHFQERNAFTKSGNRALSIFRDLLRALLVPHSACDPRQRNVILLFFKKLSKNASSLYYFAFFPRDRDWIEYWKLGLKLPILLYPVLLSRINQLDFVRRKSAISKKLSSSIFFSFRSFVWLQVGCFPHKSSEENQSVEESKHEMQSCCYSENWETVAEIGATLSNTGSGPTFIHLAVNLKVVENSQLTCEQGKGC